MFWKLEVDPIKHLVTVAVDGALDPGDYDLYIDELARHPDFDASFRQLVICGGTLVSQLTPEGVRELARGPWFPAMSVSGWVDSSNSPRMKKRVRSSSFANSRKH